MSILLVLRVRIQIGLLREHQISRVVSAPNIRWRKSVTAYCSSAKADENQYHIGTKKYISVNPWYLFIFIYVIECINVCNGIKTSRATQMWSKWMRFSLRGKSLTNFTDEMQ